MGGFVVPRPMFGLWGLLIFWFGLFLCLRWDVGVVFVLVGYVSCMLDEGDEDGAIPCGLRTNC